LKKILFLFIASAIHFLAHGQQVSEEKMQQVFQEVKTPFKYGLVLAPEDATKKIDCPTVFKKNKKWYMTYLIFDGRGYETWLASSTDLLHWKSKGRIMSFSDTTDWDNNQKAGYIALQDPEWGGSYEVQKFNGQYWMSYFGGSTRGYEAGELSIGIAHTKKNISKAKEWQRLDHPVLTAKDADVRWWENKKLYKNTIIADRNKLTGYSFVMYYNANGDSSGNKPKWRWFERIGMAVSNDMIHWKRFGADPVMHHPIGITGDAVIQKMDSLWVMFYFGAFWEGRKDAFNRFACSYDLVHWTDWKGEDLIRPSEDYDIKYAHKSFVVKYNGAVYHFYCAVDKNDNRGIAVATSIDKGKSSINFKTK
jgi:predicted GH43/DUF377 family glycosyl hydrolase